jgi:ferredoxin-NADP reductase
MARSFADIAFTPAVRAFQTRMGSRRNYAALDEVDSHGTTLTGREIEFIAERDGFYQASVGEGGWPYVQFRGNVQYISAGNIEADGRVALILMDYAARRRLKVWGRARLVDPSADPALLARLEMPSYRARVERAVVIEIEAFDWNCPQHITPRFTEAEIESQLVPLRAEIERLKAALDARSGGGATPASLGVGPMSLVVRGVRQLTPDVRAFELAAVDGEELPVAGPGAHLDVPARLASGVEATRRYSVMPAAGSKRTWEIAIQREPHGSGGSTAIHRDYAVGLRLGTARPGNDFPLHDDGRPAVLVAGGIGITPLRAMAHALQANGRDFVLHYAGRAANAMPYLDELSNTLDKRLRAYPGDRGTRMDLDTVFAHAARDSVFYVCGPARLLDAALASGARHGVLPDRIRFERFVPPSRVDDVAIDVTLHKSGKTIRVAPGQSILDAVAQAGVTAPSGCRTGTCGTCATKVLAGLPEHRDQALSVAERERAGLMCPCVSRAKTPGLTLDL